MTTTNTNYRVRSGDTLSALARRNGTTVEKLARDNGIKNPDRILVGQQLKIAAQDVFETGPSRPQPQTSQQTQTTQTSQQTQTTQTQATQTTQATTTPGAYKSVDLKDFLSTQKGTQSLAAIVVGNAEGTRTPDGGKTKAFREHTDPGNKVKNLGSFSYQHGASGPEEADRKQLQDMQGQIKRYETAVKQAGLDPNNALLASAFFDAYNQDPRASQRFLAQLPYIKEHGITPESVGEARVRSWINPETGKRYPNPKGGYFGSNYEDIAKNRAAKAKQPFRGEVDVQKALREDTLRRVNALDAALKKQGLGPTPGTTQTTQTAPTQTKPQTAPTPVTRNPITTPAVQSKGIPDTKNMTEAQKFDTYAGYFQSKGVQLDTRPDQRTILGLRSTTNTHINNDAGAYDDRLVVLWTDKNGQKHVKEFDATTEAAYRLRSYGRDLDGKGGKELGQVVDGYYDYSKSTGNSGSLKGKPVLRPLGDGVRVRYDTNHDGVYDSKDSQKVINNSSILFHGGGRTSTGSAGCQTIPPGQYNEFWKSLGNDDKFKYLLVTVN